MAELLPPLKPIPIKERLSVLYIEKGHLDVLDGAFDRHGTDAAGLDQWHRRGGADSSRLRE